MIIESTNNTFSLSISVVPNGAQVVSLFKNVQREAKMRPLVGSLLMPAVGCEAAGISPTSTPSPNSSDKTDNRDSFGFLPDMPDMRREEERIKTFDKWPISFLNPDQLARNGFYYLGRGDEVRCAFCKVEIMRWEEGDDPALDHQRWAPQCPFLRKLASAGNVPAESGAPAGTTGRDECGARAPPPPASAPVRMPGPVHARYASEASRLKTFKENWPRSMRQKPEELAEAGFFYTGQGDKTKCFYCDGGLKDWEEEDVPWEQHARWFDRCAYVQLVKGREYVQRVISEACETATPPPAAPRDPSPASSPAAAPAPAPVSASAPASAPAVAAHEDDDVQVEDSKLCRICFVEERNVCFVPCGHVVACAKCALSTDKCPMCRRTFQNAVRLYFS